MDPYEAKYLKYKEKYLNLKKEIYGGKNQELDSENEEYDDNQNLKLEKTDEIEAPSTQEEQQATQTFDSQIEYFKNEEMAYKKFIADTRERNLRVSGEDAAKDQVQILKKTLEKAYIDFGFNQENINLDKVIQNIYQNQLAKLRGKIGEFNSKSGLNPKQTMDKAKAEENYRKSQQHFNLYRLNALTRKIAELQRLVQGTGGFTTVMKAAIAKFVSGYLEKAKKQLEESKRNSLN